MDMQTCVAHRLQLLGASRGNHEACVFCMLHVDTLIVIICCYYDQDLACCHDHCFIFATITTVMLTITILITIFYSYYYRFLVTVTIVSIVDAGMPSLWTQAHRLSR